MTEQSNPTTLGTSTTISSASLRALYITVHHNNLVNVFLSLKYYVRNKGSVLKQGIAAIILGGVLLFLFAINFCLIEKPLKRSASQASRRAALLFPALHCG